MTGENKSYFEILNEIDVTDMVEQKEGLNYLSWAWAWKILSEKYPDATYEVEKFENNLPYIFDEKTGYMVFTKVTIENITKEMWLPVMDAKNKTMLDHWYTYKTKTGEKTVEKATMFDINKTIMRCLTKNLAMFGLGLGLYAGEDLPETPVTMEEAKAYRFPETSKKVPNMSIEEVAEKNPKYIKWYLESDKTNERVKQMITLITGETVLTDEENNQKMKLMAEMMDLVNTTGTDLEKLIDNYEVKSNADMTIEQLNDAIAILKQKAKKK